MKTLARILTSILWLALPSVAAAAPPFWLPPPAQVYDTPHHQAPVRARPGDYVTLPGAGISPNAVVVYRRITNPQASLTPPTSVPTVDTGSWGVLEIPLGANGTGTSIDTPRSVVGRLPRLLNAMRPTDIFALWVKNPLAPYSAPVIVNDPRPRWSTPSVAYATAPYGSLGRTIKIVGRNLELYGDLAFVWLSGPTSVVVPARAPAAPGRQPQELAFDLPSSLQPGSYTLQVYLRGIWYPVPEGRLEVRPDPPVGAVVVVSSQATPADPCLPDDGIDDTACVRDAIAAAAAAGGGLVVFPTGQWDLFDPSRTQRIPHDGLLVPPGVDLVGAGRIVKGAGWTNLSLLTLQGDNRVAGLTFLDPSTAPSATAFLRLGRMPWVLGPTDPRRIEDVRIERCAFYGMDEAIAGSGLPIRRLVVADNFIRAHRQGVTLAGGPAFHGFDVEDSAITRNRFEPGEGAYVRALSLGGSTRLDLSENVVDGAANGGWSAGFEFHLWSSHERALIAENTLTCTGSRGGGGEAIALASTHAILEAGGKALVDRAGPNLVSFPANGRPGPNHSLADAWIMVVGGPGVGQARKVRASDSGPFGRWEIRTDVPWDVVPVPGQSEVAISRAYADLVIAANRVDNTACDTTRSSGREGTIAVGATLLDSAIVGNQLFTTGGVYVGTSYAPAGNAAGVTGHMHVSYANEIRGNHLHGRPGQGLGGISVWYGSSEDPGVTLTHNLGITDNWLFGAYIQNGSIMGGLISVMQGWTVAQPDPIGPSGLLIADNLLYSAPRGVFFDGPHVARNFVFHAGSAWVTEPIVDLGTDNLIGP